MRSCLHLIPRDLIDAQRQIVIALTSVLRESVIELYRFCKLREGMSSETKSSPHVVDKIQAFEHEAVDFVKTLAWHQIEAWQQDNEYIRSGYRR